MRWLALAAVLVGSACGSREAAHPAPPERRAEVHPVPKREAHIPRTPGALAPSLVAIARGPGQEQGDGAMLADVDSCSTCHPDVAKQWASSAHSFASFGNPIYRFNVELARAELGKPASRHCGGCHDMPLMLDGLMTADAAIPADDLRAHSGVTCRLCHGVQSTSTDGNGSYTWSAAPIDAPTLGDAQSIARHRAQVTTKVDTELCVGCHRGFLSPDMNMPVHLTGIDEPGAWRNSAYTGNGLAQLDSVEKKSCIDCHMERVAASRDELGQKQGTVASHRFVGGHTWMASMRGDAEQLRLTRAKLEGAASIDVAGARTVQGGTAGAWQLPADGAPITGGTRLELDVAIRNLLVGHRFPGGVLDVQDTWIEVELADARGTRLASSGLHHAADPHDQNAHVLRTLVVDEDGQVLEHHEMAKFRSQVTTKTLGPREVAVVRYAFNIPKGVALPLTVHTRLRHRSRTLAMQEATCAAARSPQGKDFLAGARGARDITLDPCAPEPITLVAEVSVQLGAGSRLTGTRPAWQRVYEHGMGLAGAIVTQLDDARTVLDRALAMAPDARSQAMVHVQLGAVAARQGRVDDAVAQIAVARALVPPDVKPGAFDAVIADAYVRQNRWAEAVAPSKACTERAPSNASAWSLYARVLVAVGDHAAALAAAGRGLALAPRDPDLLRSQATALAALKDPQARAAQEAYTRFRAPDEAAALRIRCAKQNARCWRDRNPVQTIELRDER